MPSLNAGLELELPREGTTILQSALLYVAAGFAPVPIYGVVGERCKCGHADCGGPGKHPVGRDWQRRAKCDIDVARDLFEAHDGNIGIVVGDDHVVIDIDGYHEGYEGVKQLPAMPRTLTNRSGSHQGEHRIFRLAPGQDPKAITNRKVAPGVDIRIRSGQFVVAPSLHKSGHRYEWIDCTPPALLPDSLYEAIRKADVIPLRPPRTAPLGTDIELARIRKRAAAYIAKMPAGISGQGGHAATFAAARACWAWVEKGLPEGEAWDLLVEFNGRCEPSWNERELQHKWSQAQKAQRLPLLEDRELPGRSSGAGASGATAAAGGAAAPAAERAPFAGPISDYVDGDGGGGGGGGAGGAPPSGDDSSWRTMLIYDRRKGADVPAKHHENAIIALKYSPAWRGRIRLDTHAQRILVKNPPWHAQHTPMEVDTEREWTDGDDTRLSSWIRREIAGLSLTTDQCHKAVVVVAESNKFHPFRDELDAKKWDRVNRLDDWLRLCLGGTSTQGNDRIIALMGRWWMIGAAARTYRPGCKMDYLLILEGPQGLRKSSALKVLAGERFFTDTPVDIGSKDAYMALQGKVIVELAELTSLHGAKRDSAKAFFSSASDRYRPPYARNVIDVLRANVFAGTVNPQAYLTDDTGNRRYLPVQCSNIDLRLLAELRDQLWAEAAARYKDGEDCVDCWESGKAHGCDEHRWWPETPAEFAALEAEQLVREETDPWMEAIGRWVEGRDECTSHEVLEGACKLAVEDFTRAHEQRVGRVLRQFDFTRVRVTRFGRQKWVFVRQVKPPPP